MKTSFYKILYILIIVIIFNIQSIAQSASQPEMADLLRSNGKIYVVVGVLAIILIGIVVYLFALDRKLTTLEKKIK